MFPQLPQGLCAIPLRRYVYVLRERPFAFRHWERGGPQGTPPRDLILCLSRHLAQRLLTSAQDTLIDVVRRWSEKFPSESYALTSVCFFSVTGWHGVCWFNQFINPWSRMEGSPLSCKSYLIVCLSCAHADSQLAFFWDVGRSLEIPFRLSATNSLIRTYWTHPRHWKCLSLRHWIVPILVRVSQPSDDYSGSPIKSHQYVWQNMCLLNIIGGWYCTRTRCDMISFGFGCVGDRWRLS